MACNGNYAGYYANTCHGNVTCPCNSQYGCTCVSNCTCACNGYCSCNCNNCGSNSSTYIDLPWTSSTSSSGVTVGSKILYTHLTELYTLINSEFSKRSSSTSWSYYPSSNSPVTTVKSQTWSEIASKINTWVTTSITTTGKITSANIITLRNNLITAVNQCVCNCNNFAKSCTCQTQNNLCNCNTQCQCNANITCSCDCNCAYYTCVCNCQY